MALVLIFSGLLAAVAAGVAMLVAGAGFLAALGAYMGAGVCGTLCAALVVFLRRPRGLNLSDGQTPTG